MFRVTKDNLFSIYHIHRKFLWWYVPWVVGKNNVCNSIENLSKHLEIGSYRFTRSEGGNYWYITDKSNKKPQCIISYYKDHKDFIHQNAEWII